MLRETIHRGEQNIAASEEIEFPSRDGMKTIIPYNPDWKTLLIQVSGGLDSALLLFLTAKALANRNSKTRILPFSLEIPTKVKNLDSARRVIAKVKELTSYSHLMQGLEIIMPMSEALPPRKNQFFISELNRVTEEFGVDFEFNGNTKNPPESVRQHFRDDQWREMLRDSRTTIYNWERSASPHAFIDKSGIVDLYQKNGIVEDLATLTLSCDIDLSEQIERNLPTPCGECWWCRERAWGFEANGLNDPSLHYNS